MTFCLGIRVKEGVLGIADTRITSGNEVITARKVTVHQVGGEPFFLMTSGLRSVRDKALTYFEELIDHQKEHDLDKLYKAVNGFAQQVRKVWQEDREALEESGLHFNIHALIGGRLSRDREHKLYLLYPQGNWVEVGPGTPYSIIGASGYGKPVIDRTLKYEDDLRHALKVGCLAFDSTRISASDVDFPIDIVLHEADSGRIIQHRFDKEDLAALSQSWQETLRTAVQDLPSDWAGALLDQADSAPVELRAE